MRSKKETRTSDKGIAASYTRETLPDLRQRVLAILCSDIHLSHKPPLARSAEPDWYAAMRRQLEELAELKESQTDISIVYAGDIFDKWNSPPELINFAIEWLPDGWAVAGQHDCPLHSQKDMSKSAYWTLVMGDILFHLSGYTYDNGLYLEGFSWGQALKSPMPIREHEVTQEFSKSLRVAVIHKYCWQPKHNPAQSEKGYAVALTQQLKGFDVAVFGDNHSGFINNETSPAIINCGTFFRRRIDERDYRPMVGLLLDTGRIVPYYMDVSQDKFIEEADAKYELKHAGFADFVEELERLESDGLDFVDALKRALTTKVSKGARKLVLEALEGAKE